MIVSTPPASFEDLDLDIFYEGPGEQILTRFVLPVLQSAVSYDRVTSFFTVSSLLAIAEGVESLWRRRGRMRLILGIHDIPNDLLSAVDLAEGVDEVVAQVRHRLLDDVSHLADELARERIATIAWMMQDGLLEVRVAAPVVGRMGDTGGVFHSKRYVFRDGSGAVVTAEGSPNETVMGLGANYEELTVHMSWGDDRRYTRRHEESFERLWNGVQPDVRVVPLDASFSRDLLVALRLPPREQEPTVAPQEPLMLSRVIAAARTSPAFSVLNLGSSALFPHQERAFIDAASRWPIRAVLADEVGLGKTLEAAAVVAYAIRHCGVERVTVLAPAALVRQWQDELRLHFNLDFYRYDSGSRCFVSPEGHVSTVPRGLGPVGAHAPSLVVMSSQLSRGDRRRGHIYEGASLYPDLLVVDEAHAARVTRVPNESDRPTLLRRMLEEVIPDVPHVLLLTATPMQLDVREYFDLLSLLGVPAGWDEQMYLRSLRGLAIADSAPELQTVKTTYEGSAASILEFDPDRDRIGLSGSLGMLAEHLADNPHPSASDLVGARGEWGDLHRVAVAVHPGHLLTIRHTRGALETLGYRFPDRRFEAPDLRVGASVASFYRVVDDYLENTFGSVEAALHPDKRRSLGFMKSTYRQRLASSLRAAEITLSRRRVRLEAILQGVEVGIDEVVAEEEDEDLEVVASVDPTEAKGNSVAYACRTELFVLEDLLSRLLQLDFETPDTDPKLEALMSLIARHLSEGDALLVFSRYTDTVDACIEDFRNRHLGRTPFGKYTGGESWIDLGSGEQPVSKEGLRRSLEQGEISVVFCSDAASEGLNLQAARVIVNVDVPWNPARLEQRIGRIARLGQTADTVDVYNLWYPESVESRIYSRLLERKELYDLAVGQYPEIVSRAIKAELTATYSEGIGAIADDPIAVLQNLRTDQQLTAIYRLWYEQGGSSGAESVRQELATLLADVVRSAGGTTSADSRDLSFEGASWRIETDAGVSNALTLNHPALDVLTKVDSRRTGGNAQLSLLLVGDSPIAFVVELDDMRRILSPVALPRLLRSIVTDSPLVLDDENAWLFPSNGDAYELISRNTPWLPDSRAMTTLFDGQSGEHPLTGECRMESLGSIEAMLV